MLHVMYQSSNHFDENERKYYNYFDENERKFSKSQLKPFHVSIKLRNNP